MALITAMLASIIMAGVAVVLVSTAQTNLRVTADSRNFDDAIHTAEAGADLVVAAMNDERDRDTGHEIPEFEEGTAERQWVVDAAFDAYQRVRDGSPMRPDEIWYEHDGHFSYGIRAPESQEVYGVGIVDGRRDQVRVVVYRLSEDPFRPQSAVLTEGDINIDGSSGGVSGDGGGIHTNADFKGSNDQYKVEQGVTAGGDCYSYKECVPSSPRIRIPRVTAEQHYSDHASFASGRWYDLCPGGIVREPSSDGPCDPASDTRARSELGWSYNSGTWSRTSDLTDRVFYVQHGNVSITGNSTFTNVTMYLAMNPDDTGNSGNIDVGGGTVWRPYDDITIVADRDIRTRGNTELYGASIAGEQIRWAGSLGAEGSNENGIVIAQDRGNTPNSWVTNGNTLSGSVHISFDGNLTLPVADALRVGVWNEL